jgi:undecaprenyl pyrophosphate phosphatase UppP
MKETAPAEELEQKTGETIPDYADRLLEMFVLDKMPEVFYQAVGYVSLGLFIGLFVFAGIWALLIVITLLKTISKKPWTFFGPWFWLVGLVELFLGFGITALARFALPKLDISQFGLPISAVDAYVRTYALVPSILFVASIALAIVYQVFKSLAKKEARAAND